MTQIAAPLPAEITSERLDELERECQKLYEPMTGVEILDIMRDFLARYPKSKMMGEAQQSRLLYEWMQDLRDIPGVVVRKAIVAWRNSRNPPHPFAPSSAGELLAPYDHELKWPVIARSRIRFARAELARRAMQEA